MALSKQPAARTARTVRDEQKILSYKLIPPCSNLTEIRERITILENDSSIVKDAA